MKLTVISAFLASSVLLGCGNPVPPEPSSPEPDVTEATSVETAPEPPAEPQLTDALAGTTWSAGDFTLTFGSDGTVVIHGGSFASLSPDGAPISYTLSAEGELVIGESESTVNVGRVDEGQLKIDGVAVVKQPM
ncbi:MAG: hypothetical protein AMXMBFR84_13810 [Candidatus Hydrogenedentota bacterium]